MTVNMDDIIFSTAEYVDGQQQDMPHYGNDWMYSPAYTSTASICKSRLSQLVNKCIDYLIEQSALWPASNSAYPQLAQHQPYTASMRSSLTSHSRTSSNDSVFSQWKARASMTSTNTFLSHVSERPHSQSSLVPSVDLQQSMQLMHTAPSTEWTASPAPSKIRRKSVQRQATPDRDVFTTCVSKKRRSRRSQGEPRYWCTSCEEPFIEKFDWKRHEDTYQERRFVFRCSLCSAKYFLEKDFHHHHKTRHNCETCHRDEHQEAAKQERQRRTGWGCGFCTHFSTDWRERCNHVAQHFEKDCKTMQDWRHSDVILSLLQRPAIKVAWCKILHSQPQLRTDFGWNQHNTGRVEGYPENDAKPHLQDLLEYYRSSDDAAALAQLAFEKIAFPSCPPPAPRKDYKDHHTTSLQSLMDDQASWNLLMSTIPEDDIPPTNTCQLDYDISNNLFDENSKFYY